MRNLPGYVAVLFLMLAISRVASFVAVALVGGSTMGWFGGILFSLGVAVGIIAAAYRIAFKEGRWLAVCITLVFMAVDLFFNEAELIRVLSARQMVASEANFLGLDSETLTNIMQVAALIYGAFQTAAMALLGWLQGTAAQVPELNKPGLWARVKTALGKVVLRIGLAFVVRIEAIAEAVQSKTPSGIRQLTGTETRASDVTELRRQNWDWRKLAPEVRAQLAGKTAAQIRTQFPGLPSDTARHWSEYAAELVAGERQ